MSKALIRGGLLSLCLGAFLTASAQDECKNSDWFIGTGAGLNLSSLSYSELDDSFYPDKKNNLSGVFNVFFEYDFGKNRSFAIRPTFSFLTRGGRISNIGKDYYTNYLLPDTDPNKLDDVFYSLKATYFDFRIPVMYQIGSYDWKVRPFVYVAPILGFVTGGHTRGEFQYTDGTYDGVRYKLTKANMNPFYFAGAVGVGAKWQLNVGCSKLYIGLDVNYQFGFTNTYGSSEKKGELDHVASFAPSAATKVSGTRRLNGLELGLSVGIPLSIFQARNEGPIVVRDVEYNYVEVVPEVVVEEQPCYSLDEIMTMINNGTNVAGKKICAIEDNINFEFGKSTIMPSSYPYLNSLAEMIKRTGMKVKVMGHTDNVGTPEFNMKLSKERTMTVVRYLQNHGVNSSNITYQWYGLTKPMTTNDTEEGRKQNRRVEFEIINY